MSEVLPVNETICKQMLLAKLDAEGIKLFLKEKGISGDELVAAYLHTVKKIRYAKRRSIGFICLVVGALLGLLSCVLTIAHVLPEMFEFIFYGLTTLAVCIVLLGLYYIFE